ncbi:DUF7123 family protein [Haloarcula nitratireducens]|uniref:DUF7123 domain-containing protein n=1 Tax=Haloarcula nitratireducens TaxID=2487749 RepID=A0AAW4PH31_9EURY|nr:hypothetical protein [Halomicroarcula nitratireducens]MBX0297241.1 hypothetical protein [Halomicroarcula nitratireducens]
MSSPTKEIADTQNTELSERQTRILEYLRDQAPEQTYFKSRLIAAELELSSKEVGANMPIIQQAATHLEIEKWGYSSGTTWKVTP